MDIMKLGKTTNEIKEIVRKENFIDAGTEIYTENELYKLIKEREMDSIKNNLKDFITDHYNSTEDFMDFLDGEKVWNFIHYTIGMDWEDIEQDTKLNSLVDYLMYIENTCLSFNEMVELIIKYDLFCKALFGIEDMLYRDNENEIIDKWNYDINDIIKYNNETFYTLMD